MNGDTVLIIVSFVVAFIVAVYPLYYKVGKLEGKVNILCKLLNPRRKRDV